MTSTYFDDDEADSVGSQHPDDAYHRLPTEKALPTCRFARSGASVIARERLLWAVGVSPQIWLGSDSSIGLSPTNTTWMLYLDEAVMDTTGDTRVHEDFTVFVGEVEPKLSYALAATYGVEVGRESTADALAYAWENWPKLREVDNPAGYLYRVGQSAAKKHRRRPPLFPPVVVSEMPVVEPALPAALDRLSRSQRTAVVLLYVLDWSEREAADFLGVNRSSVRRHRDRGLKKLRKALEVDSDG